MCVCVCVTFLVIFSVSKGLLTQLYHCAIERNFGRPFFFPHWKKNVKIGIFLLLDSLNIICCCSVKKKRKKGLIVAFPPTK